MASRRLEKIILNFFMIMVLSMTQKIGKAQENSHHQLDSFARYVPSRSVEAMPGEIKLIETNAEYSYEFRAFDKLPVKISLGNMYIGIEDTLKDIELPSHLTGLTTDIETTLPFFNFHQTYFRIGLSSSFFADDWDFPASSFRILSRYFLIYQPTSQWTFLSGIAVYPNFENEVLPILGFIYKPNDKLIFNIIPKRPNITYLLSDKISLFAEGGSSLNSEFEVLRNNEKNVVLRYRETHLGGGIKLKLNQYIECSLSTGGIFNRTLKYRDNQGKANIKDGLYTEFRVEIKA